jgi:hypothetical protein
MHTIKHYQPHYGPSGEPYRVRARFADRTTVEHFWSQAEALEARDRAFDQGAKSVHVSGLPFIGAAAGLVLMTANNLPLSARERVPQDHGAVPAGRSQGLAVRGVGDE